MLSRGIEYLEKLGEHLNALGYRLDQLVHISVLLQLYRVLNNCIEYTKSWSIP